jgi:hypothetical protein
LIHNRYAYIEIYMMIDSWFLTQIKRCVYCYKKAIDFTPFWFIDFFSILWLIFILFSLQFFFTLLQLIFFIILLLVVASRYFFLWLFLLKLYIVRKECCFDEFSVELINETLSPMLPQCDNRQGLDSRKRTREIQKVLWNPKSLC